MKQIIMFLISLVFANQFSFAGSISDDYATGDVLTAGALNNIKTAVNDNNNASNFYGDGSAGPITVSGNTSWEAVPPAGGNLNFSDLVIGAGQILTVPAGTTIRCNGSFTNNGTVIVARVGNGGVYAVTSNPSVYAQVFIVKPGKGDSLRSATNPQGHIALGVSLSGGSGGQSIPKTVSASSFNNFVLGGGGGSGTQSEGGASGGGLVKIYCKGTITNNGTIAASGEGGVGGGGGGGIVILASSTSVNNSEGIIVATGGNGDSNELDNGASGGGGGGIVILAAPMILNNAGTPPDVSAGLAGTSGITLTNANHSAGGGGGACGGQGGGGGVVSVSNIASTAGKGIDGYILEITANPSHMM